MVASEMEAHLDNHEVWFKYLQDSKNVNATDYYQLALATLRDYYSGQEMSDREIRVLVPFSLFAQAWNKMGIKNCSIGQAKRKFVKSIMLC